MADQRSGEAAVQVQDIAVESDQRASSPTPHAVWISFDSQGVARGIFNTAVACKEDANTYAPESDSWIVRGPFVMRRAVDDWRTCVRCMDEAPCMMCTSCVGKLHPQAWHHMIKPGVAGCGADYSRMTKTEVVANVTCVACLQKLMTEMALEIGFRRREVETLRDIVLHREQRPEPAKCTCLLGRLVACAVHDEADQGRERARPKCESCARYEASKWCGDCIREDYEACNGIEADTLPCLRTVAEAARAVLNSRSAVGDDRLIDLAVALSALDRVDARPSSSNTPGSPDGSTGSGGDSHG